MAIHFSDIHIGKFRGINELRINNLNHINIIAGDNNSGKTSVLEALLLLKNPTVFTNLILIARNRDFYRSGGSSIFQNFLNLFPRDGAEECIRMDAVLNGMPISIDLCGEQKKVMIDTNDEIKYRILKRRPLQENAADLYEADAFEGELECQIGPNRSQQHIQFHEFMKVSGMEIKSEDLIRMKYLSPIDHMVNYTFDMIIRNDEYKKICLAVLQIFDPAIEDLFILKALDSVRIIENIKHSKLGVMPIATYGDGIKKVLSLANGIARAAGGILLIDEVETAIHSKYFAEIFKFIELAAIEYKVQVFITTHSIEAIDSFLQTQNYDLQEKDDHISVITFKKDSESYRTLSRVLTGRQVAANREDFGFEVRL